MKSLLLLLAAASLACGQGDLSPDEMRKQALAHGGAVDLANSGYDEAFPLNWLPPEVKYDKGEVSLIPDSRHRQDRFIGVYLVNATNLPLKRINRTLNGAYQEVRTDPKEDVWESTGYGSFCGTMSPEELQEKELPPGQAMVFLALAPSAGDTEGELRYTLTTMGRETFSSKPLPGRYDSKQFRTARARANRDLLASFPPIPPDDKPFDWSHGLDESGRERIVASLSFLSQSPYVRDVARRWLAHLDANGGNPSCRAALRELLQQDRPIRMNAAPLFERCFEALSADADAVHDYGNPGKFHDIVWRYLVGLTPQHLGPSGNPWGVADEKAAALVSLAMQRIQARSGTEIAPAAKFLGSDWLSDRWISDADLHSMLSSPAPEVRSLAVISLVRRGQRNTAGAWLRDQRKQLAPEEVSALWGRTTDGGPMRDWETLIALETLSRDAGETLQRLKTSSDRCLAERKGQVLPDALRMPIRALLQKEIDRPTLFGQEAPQKKDDGEWDFPTRYPDYQQVRKFKCALWVLGHWKNENDLGLLRAFLKHPLAYYEASSKNPVKVYDLRSEAAEVLARRFDKDPTDAKLKEELSPQ